MNRIFAIVLTAAAVAVAGPAVAQGPSKCFASWSDAAPIVKREALAAIEHVSALARPSLSGAEIVKTTLCEEQGRYVYHLVVRDAAGHLKLVAVDARHPFGK
jgi:hypothetical protein